MLDIIIKLYQGFIYIIQLNIEIQIACFILILYYSRELYSHIQNIRIANNTIRYNYTEKKTDQ